MRRFLLAPAIAMALAAPLGAQVVSNGPPASDVGPIGRDYFTAVAQPFMSPAAVYLQSFTFYMTNDLFGDGALFTAAIYQFSNNAVLGAAKFKTDPFPGIADPNTDVPITIGSLATAPLNIALSANVMYALVLSSLDDQGKSTPGAGVEIGLANNAFFGGLLFAAGTDLTTANAFQSFDVNDLAFSATVTSAPVVSTPEPASLMLVATGLAGVGGMVARRRKKAA